MPDMEKVLQVEQNIAWLPQPNEGRIVLSSRLPAQELCVTALVLAFMDDRFLQTHLVKRGWDLVGGHIEAGETPEEAVRREAYEETGAKLGQLQLLGYQHLRLSGPRPDNYPYPHPESYQVYYYAQIVALETISANQETQGRGLFSPEEAASLPWVQAHRALYLAALARARGQES